MTRDIMRTLSIHSVFSLSASLQAILPVKLQVTSPNSKICLVLILINSIYKYTFPHLFLYSFQDNQSQFKLVPTVIISHMESDRIGLFRQIDVSYMYSVFRHFFVLLSRDPSGQLLLALPNLEVGTIRFLKIVYQHFIFSFGHIVQHDAHYSSMLGGHTDSTLICYLDTSTKTQLHQLREINMFCRLIYSA